jgi:hypothetical protein
MMAAAEGPGEKSWSLFLYSFFYFFLSPPQTIACVLLCRRKEEQNDVVNWLL